MYKSIFYVTDVMVCASEVHTCAGGFMDVSCPVSRAQAHGLPVPLERETFSAGEQTSGARGRWSLPAGRRRQ